MTHRTQNNTGMSLLEMLIAATVFIVAFVVVLISYLTCLELNEVSKNTSTALHATKARFEQIQNTPFNQIKAAYHNVTYTATGLTGMGVSYVDDTNPRLLKITLSFSWKQPGGRMIGEDTNLNGVLNAGEDKNANGIIDSPVEVVSYLFQ